MTREAYDTTRMTPFALWIRTHCRDSRKGLSVTNIDFEVEDFRNRPRLRTMLIEEKMHMGRLHYGQAMHFKRLDRASRLLAEQQGYDHDGFYIVQFSGTGPLDSALILVNGVELDAEQLVELINGDVQHVAGLDGRRPQEWERFIGPGR